MLATLKTVCENPKLQQYPIACKSFCTVGLTTHCVFQLLIAYCFECFCRWYDFRLPLKHTTILFQVFNQVPSFHYSSKTSFSVMISFPEYSFSNSSLCTSRYRFSASERFSLSSSIVFACESTAGISCNCPTNQPSSDFSIIAVNSRCRFILPNIQKSYLNSSKYPVCRFLRTLSQL